MKRADPLQEDSYALWVRIALKRVRRSGGTVTALFDSSVPEPTDLLANELARAFTAPITQNYVSAFVSGNRFVVEHLEKRYGVGAERILCTTGATAALSHLYDALLEPGDTVLVETPGFDLFHGFATLRGIEARSFARKGPSFDVDVERIASLVDGRTRMIVLSNLHNPSSAAFGIETFRELDRLAERHDLLIVVDEVYRDYADRDAPLPEAASISPRFISINSLTKIFGLSTLRCGWIVASAEIVDRVRAFTDRYDFGISNLAHAAAALVLDARGSFERRTDEILAASRPVIAAALDGWKSDGLIEGDLPRHGCIIFPKLVGIEDTIAFADWLGDRCGVLVAPGEYFGSPGHVRIGFAKDPKALGKALDALGEGLRSFGKAAVTPTLASVAR